MANLYEVLARVRSQTTTDEDAEWLEDEFDHFGLILEYHNQHYRDLLAAWEENAHLRDLLRSAWRQTRAERWRPELNNNAIREVWFTVRELQQIAVLFVAEADDA